MKSRYRNVKGQPIVRTLDRISDARDALTMLRLMLSRDEQPPAVRCISECFSGDTGQPQGSAEGGRGGAS